MDVRSAFDVLAALRELAASLADSAADPGMRDRARRLDSAAVDLQRLVLELQGELQAQQRANEELEQALIEATTWDDVAAGYSACEIADGVFVYARRTQPSGRPPMPWLCTNCFDERRKSILQRNARNATGTFYICHRCSAQILDHSERAPRIPEHD